MPINKYHLKFEVQPFEKDLVLIYRRTNRVRSHLVEQFFRNWSFVSSIDLQNVTVNRIEDECSPFYTAFTETYLPWWLRDNEYLPADKKFTAARDYGHQINNAFSNNPFLVEGSDGNDPLACEQTGNVSVNDLILFDEQPAKENNPFLSFLLEANASGQGNASVNDLILFDEPPAKKLNTNNPFLSFLSEANTSGQGNAPASDLILFNEQPEKESNADAIIQQLDDGAIGLGNTSLNLNDLISIDENEGNSNSPLQSADDNAKDLTLSEEFPDDGAYGFSPLLLDSLTDEIESNRFPYESRSSDGNSGQNRKESQLDLFNNESRYTFFPAHVSHSLFNDVSEFNLNRMSTARNDGYTREPSELEQIERESASIESLDDLLKDYESNIMASTPSSNVHNTRRYARLFQNVANWNFSDTYFPPAITRTNESFNSWRCGVNYSERRRKFNSRIDAINLDDLSFNAPESLEDASELNISIEEPEVQRDKALISDFVAVKKYVDSVINYQTANLNQIERGNEIRVLLAEAAAKTAAENINLERQGLSANMRYAQLCQRLSTNSLRITDEGRIARENYNKEAQRQNEHKILKAPKRTDRISSSIRTILNSDLSREDFNRMEFKRYQTVADLKETSQFRQAMANILRSSEVGEKDAE